jgi:hypothetical protein
MKISELKQIIKEEILNSLNENEVNLDNLDTYIIKNRDEVLKNLSTYGFDVEDVPNMRNYIDVASVLGLDSRLFKEVDLQYVTDIMYDILRDEEF